MHSSMFVRMLNVANHYSLDSAAVCVNFRQRDHDISADVLNNGSLSRYAEEH